MQQVGILTIIYSDVNVFFSKLESMATACNACGKIVTVSFFIFLFLNAEHDVQQLCIGADTIFG